MIKTTLFICAAAASLGLAQANAVTIGFSGGSQTSGAFGNTRAFTGGGVTVEASAQSFVNGAWQNSYLGLYTNGLGVTNSLEGSGGGGTHTVDNIGSIDRVRFSFSTAVVLDAVSLAAYGDTDITAYYFAGGLWNVLEHNYGGYSSRSANINAGAVSASLWAVGALNPANGSSDSFKICSVTFNTLPPPPPPSVPDSGGSLLLLAMGAGILVLAKGRAPIACSVVRG